MMLYIDVISVYIIRLCIISMRTFFIYSYLNLLIGYVSVALQHQ